MNILQITLRADYGGGPEHVFILEKYIDKNYFNIYTACPRQKPYYDLYKNLSKDTFTLPFRKFKLKVLYRLLLFCRKNKINLIHAHGKGAGIYGRLLGLFLRTPIIYTLHGVDYNHLGMKKYLYIFIERFLNIFTSKIINVSNTERITALSLKLYNRDKSIVIPNGIDINKYLYASSYDRAVFDLCEDDFIIGNISRFDLPKGLPYLLKSFQRVSIPNKKLVIIGDGDDRDEIVKLINKLNLEKSVKLLGFRDDVCKIIKMFDMYVSTSIWEGLPISILEVMASEVPIVATDVVGNNELIVNNITGKLCKSKNISNITQSINCMFNSKQKDVFIKNALELVSSKYSVANMIAGVEEIYKSIC